MKLMKFEVLHKLHKPLHARYPGPRYKLLHFTRTGWTCVLLYVYVRVKLDCMLVCVGVHVRLRALESNSQTTSSPPHPSPHHKKNRIKYSDRAVTSEHD
jgi:hypothetical protein